MKKEFCFLKPIAISTLGFAKFSVACLFSVLIISVDVIGEFSTECFSRYS